MVGAGESSKSSCVREWEKKGLIGKSYGHELVRKYSSFFLLVENDVEDIV